MKQIATSLIRLYQWLVSPILAGLGGGCRFEPSCSHYAHQAFDTHPAHRAAWLTLKRIARCGPWHSGGIDHVPDPNGAK